jgi:hypothetical protein
MHYQRAAIPGSRGHAEALAAILPSPKARGGPAQSGQPACLLPGCGRAAKARGLCPRHYFRATHPGTKGHDEAGRFLRRPRQGGDFRALKAVHAEVAEAAGGKLDGAHVGRCRQCQKLFALTAITCQVGRTGDVILRCPTGCQVAELHLAGICDEVIIFRGPDEISDKEGVT